jgi:hydroxymethylpyrimidine pyrophosphatase-like HAD family hydrolase
LYVLALATDYDGTLAHQGAVDAATLAALERFKATGRRLILVTGRELPDLKRCFPQLSLFDRVVAENGALIYDPASEKETVIAEPPPEAFVRQLRARNVAPLSVGRAIVATWEPHGTTVLQVIRDLGLELQIIFNKGAVMVLPAGVNKATGLAAVLPELELSAHNVVAVGDAENDHAFLRASGCGAAVSNALPMLMESAHIKLAGRASAGVVELIETIERADARILPPARHGIALGHDGAGQEILIEPYAGSVLIAGKSGIGKSTLATALTERMAEQGFEFCVFDPEGDYDELQNAVSIGDPTTAPTTQEAVKLVRQHATNVVINTQFLNTNERPAFFTNLLPHVAALRAQTGRPHWLLIDEAHHLLPAARRDVCQILPENIPAAIFVTVHPDAVAAEALKGVETVVALGDATEVIASFCRVLGIEPPQIERQPGDEEVLVWRRGSDGPARVIAPLRPKQSHKRHTRKYAQGDVGKHESFYFRGPENALNLRAPNLGLFMELAQGVDDRTWMHHLRRGDYSAWFRKVIKDSELADEAAEVEADAALKADESRQRIGQAIIQRYTAPAAAPR